MKRRMLYAGTFDPVTNGHLDIIQRGVMLCDELVIGVVKNYSKSAFFTVDERTEMIRAAVSEYENVFVDDFEGLLADYVNEHDIDVVLRGLRATTDFEYEIQIAQMNARLFHTGVETIFLMTNPSHSFISSSIVKEVFKLGGNIDGLVHPEVLSLMQKKLLKEQKNNII